MTPVRPVAGLEAIHEAGHAVIATIRGLDVERLTILPVDSRPGFDGGCYITGQITDAVTCLAGPLASARASEAEPDLLRQSDDDYDDDEEPDFEIVAVHGRHERLPESQRDYWRR